MFLLFLIVCRFIKQVVGPDDDDNGINAIDTEQDMVSPPDIDICSMTTSYAFAALPDQRLLADDKCRPYVLDDNFRWTILHGTGVRPPKIENRSAGFCKVRAAGL